MIVVHSKILKSLKIRGITLFPFIILVEKKCLKDNVLINHEKIHLRQQLELLLIFFYIWYVIEYYYWFIVLKDKYLAYRNICFEKEAYAHEQSQNYLKTRRPWSFWKYIKKAPSR